MVNHHTKKIKLTRAEKQQLKALMARNQQKGKKGPHTAQDTIPYQRMWPDGICRKDGPCPFSLFIAVGSSKTFAAGKENHHGICACSQGPDKGQNQVPL